MIYIVVALKSEAQAFVDRYTFDKSKLGDFTLFSNQTYSIILSGIGVTKARDATQTLIDAYDICDDDIYLNLGICGASKVHEIGALLEIGVIDYEGISYLLKKDKKEIFCVHEAIDKEEYKIVDMESYGFYDAVIHSPAIKNIFILKVVSDHFRPKQVTKEATKSLLFNQINAINKLINYKASS